MCGIGGLFERKRENKNLLKKILYSIKHRGPDHSGFWNNENVYLGSNRLKVVNLNDNSNQPFHSKNKRYALVFNGEIYNHKKLKKKFNLETLTNSDTEVIIELFSKIGVKAFEKLDGMFSIAVYDKLKNNLYLARDPFGIKPLYYYKNKNKLIFCSEIKGILNYKKFSSNNQAIIDFIKWGGLDHSSNTWFRNIFSVEPGYYIFIDNDYKLFKKKYYFLENNIDNENILRTNSSLYFKNLLAKSVSDQSTTVRSIGSHLSGGVDSSIVTMFLSKKKKNINTYTFGYLEKDYDEREKALKISQMLNLKNFTSICTPKDINNKFIDTLLMEDEPFTSFRQVSHHKLYEDYKFDGSTVIMESSGGDEIGAGYTGFIWPLYLDQIKTHGYTYAWKNFIENLKLNNLNYSSDVLYNYIKSSLQNQKNYGTSTSDGTSIVESNYISSEFEKRYDAGPPVYSLKFENNLLNSQYIELFHTKLQRGLRYVDRASSSTGREARVPLLSKKLVEFCFSIPNEAKIKNGELRSFMKQSLKYIKKDFIKLSNKKSVADPQRIWIKNEFKGLFLKLFKSNKFKKRDIFNQQQVLNNYYYFLKNNRAHSLGIFQIFITEIWLRLFIDNDPNDFRGIKLDEFISETNQ